MMIQDAIAHTAPSTAATVTPAGALVPFRADDVPETVIEQVLAEGLRIVPADVPDAPHFVIVRSPDTRSRLAKLIHDEAFRLYPLWRLAAKLMPALQRLMGRRVSGCSLSKWSDAPVVMLIHHPAEGVTPEQRDHLIQHILLAAQVAGLQALRLDGLSPVINRSKAIRCLLGFPQTLSIDDIVALGYPTAAQTDAEPHAVRSCCTWV